MNKRTNIFLTWTTAGFLAGVLLIAFPCFGQRGKRVQRERSPRQELVYDNHNYLPVIRSVKLHPTQQEAGFPVLFLGQDDPLLLSFDDLRGDVRNFYFSIEHCSADWESSRLSPLEYAEGFNEDRIDSFQPSVNTLQPYTHYRVEIPSRQVRPRLPGNYLLKVYEDADKRRLILTRRFYVVSPAFDVGVAFRPSPDNSRRATHQKLDLTIHTGTQSVSDPHRDLRVLVLQNQRPDVQEWVRQPSYIGSGEIRYHSPGTLNFPGGNEFRSVDLRSLHLASERMATLRTDTLVHVGLVRDVDLSGLAYGSLFDEDGAFFIRNLDRQHALEESDYAQVTFSLDAAADGRSGRDRDADQGRGNLMRGGTGEVYVVGAFNAYQLVEENRLHFNERAQIWQVTLPLKQGLYDYEYVYRESAVAEPIEANDGALKAVSPAVLQPFRFSGSHYQTGNQYQVLVYYRRPGTTWDEICGFTSVTREGN